MGVGYGLGMGYGGMSGYGGGYPRVLPQEYYGPQDPGHELAEAIFQNRAQGRADKAESRAEDEYAYQKSLRPDEVAGMRAGLVRSGVSLPASETGEGTEPVPGRSNNGAPPTTQAPARPVTGDPTMGGADVGQPQPGSGASAMPGAYDPATGQHNSMLASVPLGNGFRFTDPAVADAARYRAMGFQPEQAELAARNPTIASRMLQDKFESQYRETPEDRFARDLALAKAREGARYSTDVALARMKGDIAGPHGGMTRAQAQKWVDDNYSGTVEGQPSLTPSQRLITAERIYESSYSGRGGAGKSSLFQPHGGGTNTPPDNAAAGTSATPANAAPSAAGAAAPPRQESPTGASPKGVLTGDAAIRTAADSLAGHPEISDAQAHQLLTKHGFDEGHIAQVLQLRRSRRGRPTP